jgi:prepilin-type N-terminal cleavage/methylation domain-containing protein
MWVKKRPCETGFTLLELIVVLSLVTIILGLSTLAFVDSFGTAGLDSAGRDVLATLRSARMLAKSAGVDQVVRFDLDAGRFGIEGRETRKTSPGIRIRIMDPVKGMISRGAYSVKFYTAGEIDGAYVLLATRKKMIRIYFDPVVGPMLVK